MTVRKLTADEVEFALECLPETMPVKGNASAIDDETDAATEQWIYEQLENGNPWAWCCVKVSARWKDFEENDFMGGCSYLSEEDFKNDGYYDDMKAAALQYLNKIIAKTVKDIAELSV